jgi:hypothetical protein
MSLRSKNEVAQISSLDPTERDALTDLSPIDLSRGFALSGVLRPEDMEVAARLPTFHATVPPQSKTIQRVKRVLVCGGILVLLLIGMWTDDRKDSRSANFFMGGFAVASFGLWALGRRHRKAEAGSQPHPAIQYVLQDENLFLLDDLQLRQFRWRDPWLWRSETLLGIQEGDLVYPFPRRFCAGSDDWNQLTAWLSERIENSDVLTPDDYDGGGPYQEFDYRAAWSPLVATPVTATSQSPLTAADVLEWDRKWKQRPGVGTPLLVAAGVAALAAMFLLVPAGNVRSFVFGLASPVFFLAVLFPFAGPLWRRRLRRLMLENPTQYVVRQSCLEREAAGGRHVYRWDDLRRMEIDDHGISLLVTGQSRCILLLRRQFVDADWQRLRNQAAQLPEFVFGKS